MLFLFGLLALSCSKPSDQVLIRFQNTLNTEIRDAQYEFDKEHITYVGRLARHSKTGYLPFDYFEIGSGVPMGVLKGMDGANTFSASSAFWCGTGIDFSLLEPGKYTIVISEIGTGKRPYYQLKFAD